MIRIRETVNIECDFFGPEEGVLVVLISGAGAPAEFWPIYFCKGLADSGFRVIRFCNRDTGNSSHFDEPYDIWELFHDLVSLIDTTKKTNVHLVGHSMGAFLSQIAVCFSSLPIKSVVSISGGSSVKAELYSELGMTGPSESTWTTLMKNQPSGDFESDLNGWLSTWKFLNGRVTFDHNLARSYTESLYQGDPRNAQVATNHVHAMTTIPEQLIEKLGESNCPFLILHGTEDVLVPFDNGAVTARVVPNSKFVGLEGAGHMFFNNDVWLKIRDLVVEHITNH